jgi:hypothetical protein
VGANSACSPQRAPAAAQLNGEQHYSRCSQTVSTVKKSTASMLVARMNSRSEGLQHGYFDLTIDCEIVSHGRRQLTIHAGKSYRFLIPKPSAPRGGAN